MSNTVIVRFWDTAYRVDPAAAMARTVSAGFIAGFLGMLLFHQGTVFLLHYLSSEVPAMAAVFGKTPAPFSPAPMPPFGLHDVLPSALWGGAWGILLAAALRRWGRVAALVFGLCFGALLLTFVEFTLVAAVQDLPPFAGGDRQTWWRTGIANGAWGWGTALMLLLALPRRG